MVRYAVTTTIFIEAANASEAALLVERDHAGRFESELVSVTGHAGSATGARCPVCSSERIEHHEDIVVRRHFRRVRADGTLVFDAFTDSFDDDGMRARLWCGDCSQEWDLPEGEMRLLER